MMFLITFNVAWIAGGSNNVLYTKNKLQTFIVICVDACFVEVTVSCFILISILTKIEMFVS